MHWKKLGLIFSPDPRQPWMQTHACLPAPIHLKDDVFRVFFASRDAKNRSHVGFFDIRLGDNPTVVRVAEKPVLAPGPLGTFDDHGVYGTSVVRHLGRYYLYTFGWNRGARHPLFYTSIGLALSDDGENFTRYSPAPILGRSEFDPYFVTAPVVMIEVGRWRMWYVSGIRWDEVNGELQSCYHVKHAWSADGIHWICSHDPVLTHSSPKERHLARMWVIKQPDGYRAWHGYSLGDGYHIGFATSPDGLHWQRRPNYQGITRSPSGFDSEMIEHPAIVPFHKRWYMFYNGNAFGKDGVGLAVADTLD